MTYTKLSPLTKTSDHYTGAQLWEAFAPMTPPDQAANAKKLLNQVATLAVELDLDEVILASIIWIETGAAGSGLPFRASWWVNGFNAGNLGITGDPKQNAAAQTWRTPTDSAYGLTAHYVAYAYGNTWRSAWSVDDLGQPWIWDVRFDLVLKEYGGKAFTSIEDLNNRWAVDVDGSYGAKLADRANKIVAAIKDPPVTTPSTGEEPVPNIYRRVPHPPYIDLPVSKPNGGGYGYTQIPRGSRNIVGVMNHETQGRGSGQWYRDFFSCPSGERCADADVDYLITRDGTIYRFNDPTNDRSPWANGGPLGLEGDGPAFYSKFGASGINNSLISIEYEKLDHEDYTDAQVQSGGLLNAYWHDNDSQDWETYPYVPKYGCVTSLAHFEIGTTSCGMDELDDITRMQGVARGTMKKYQTQAVDPPVPIPPEVPTQPEIPTLPGGVTVADASKAFGTLTKHTPDGKTRDAAFDPRGPISLSYVHRCVEVYGTLTGNWPRAEDWWALSDSGKALDIVTFSNDWQLVRTADRQALMWARFADAELEDAA